MMAGLTRAQYFVVLNEGAPLLQQVIHWNPLFSFRIAKQVFTDFTFKRTCLSTNC